MDLASAVFKRILEENNIDLWARLDVKFFKSENIKSFYKEVNKYFSTNCALPSFETLKVVIRDRGLMETLALISSIEVDESASTLFEYFKAEYAQTLILEKLEKYLKNTVTFESAEDSVNSLQQIVLDVQSDVIDATSDESMQRMELFESEEKQERYIPLGLNAEYDRIIQFAPGDLVMLGGKRGAGKSVTCSNIAHRNTLINKKSTMYFTIEMTSRAILQRVASIATQVELAKFKKPKELMNTEDMMTVAHWWCSRFENGSDNYQEFLIHRDFKKLHSDLQRKTLLTPQIDIIYDPNLSLTKIRTELSKKVKALDVNLVIVDYVNQVKYGGTDGQYEWKDQIEVSKALKNLAQEFGVVVLSPYQIDASGEARFAKGILDAADAAFILNPNKPEDLAFTLKCTKMREAREIGFTSTMNWDTITIGPNSAEPPTSSAKALKETTKPKEDVSDVF